ncbi:capsular biosynthesis protein [Moraxella osloensis]|uniref:Capsular biosynthesis protein n=2 Tax=Bacteria TaxID=2 RepID=A0AA91FHR2_FAUOS|nr:glycosyltransferase family 4 protein [Moraxella osloensis]OBX62466.1 capsular biosynthesis protein [Moraxella osloensis]
MKPKKFFLMTTVPMSLNFFKGQINELSKEFDVTLISSPDNVLKKIAQRENVKYRTIAMKRDISLKDDISGLLKFLYLFAKERPQIIHCNTPKASLLGLTSGYLTRVPNRIYYIHGLRYEGTTGKKRQLLVALEKLNCFCATDIIAVSNGIKQKVEQQLTKKPVRVIHNGSANGLDINEFTNNGYNLKVIREEYGISENDFVFGFVGRLVKDKGIEELVGAFNQLEQKDIKLILVGNYEPDLDPLSRETLQIIKSNPNIIEVGFQKDVKKFLSIMDLFVSPSYREGFGVAVLEANLMKVPVLVSNITGHSEIVTQGINGFFVNPKNVQDLQEKMNHMLVIKEQLIKMKNACREEVMKKYDHNDVLKQAILFYSQFN